MEILDNIQIVVAVIFGIAFILFLASIVYFQIFEKDGKEPKGCAGKFILCIILVLAAFFLVSMCGGNNAPWQPRHTQLVNPELKEVNTLIFTACKA